MRPRLALVFVSALIATLALVSPARADTTQVDIPDAAFKTCIAEELGVPADSAITRDQMAGIRDLVCHRGGEQIRSLNGWEWLVGVQHLEVVGHDLGAAEVPVGLVQLQVLDLRMNKLSRITVPDTLTALTTLHLAGNDLASVELPETLTRLESLNLGYNKLSTIVIPEAFTSLSVLDLSHNVFAGITIPDTLTQLRQLSLDGNRLSNIALPPTLRMLSSLNLADNELATIAIPTAYNNLESVALSGNRLSDLSSLTWLEGRLWAARQRVVLPDVRTTSVYTFPLRDDRGGYLYIFTGSPGATVYHGSVVYDIPGTYSFSFENASGSFSGTITQSATGPSGPEVPDRSGIFGDHTGDGIADFYTVNDAGHLYVHLGSTTQPAAFGGMIGSGWGSMTYLAQIDDLDGDRRSDLLARRGTDQSLWLYRGLGRGRVSAWKQMGANWGGMDQIVPAGNLGGGSTQYVVARRASDGALFRYRLTPEGLTDIKHIGQNWQGMKQILSVGDLNRDGRSDILAIRNDGTLWAYLATSTGGIGSGRQVGHGWNDFTRAFTAGDLSGDSIRDLVGQRKDGTVFAYENRRGSWGTARQIMTGTQSVRLMA